MNSYEYDEWYDHIDELEIEFDDDPAFKQFKIETRSLQVVSDTLKKLNKYRNKFAESQKLNLKNQQEKFKQKKKNLLRQFQKRMQKAKSYTETVDFMKTLDTIAFNLGVVMFGGFAYIMGRWPHRGFYIFYSIFVPLLIFIRFVNYIQKKWHYFLIDFCYFAGAIIVLFVSVGSKNDYLYRVAFMYANGALAVATAAFSNKLVFHKFDQLISISLHAVPLTCMWNVKQITIEYEKTLPDSERRFARHPTNESFRDAFIKNFVVPYALYFIWAACYYTVNFIISAKKIREQQYLTLYTWFSEMKWAGPYLRMFGRKWAGLIFMTYHLIFFSICHIFAVISFYYETAHTCLTLLWLNVCIWNGSVYYVRYLKYTSAQKIVSEPTANMAQASPRTTSASTK